MGYKVSNLSIAPQTGAEGTYYASWDFKAVQTVTSSGAIKVGDLVTIKSGATYYGGQSIPSWVMSDSWYVTKVQGDRAVLGQNASKTNNIISPVNVNNLNNGSSGSTTTTTTDFANFDHFEVQWWYETGDKAQFKGSSATVGKECNCTYNPPDNAIRIRVTVLPVSTTYNEKGADGSSRTVSHWNGEYADKYYDIVKKVDIDKPSAPTVELDNYKLRMSVENVSDPQTYQIRFQVVKGVDDAHPYYQVDSTVLACRATAEVTLDPGGEYRVRCQTVNSVGNATYYSDWSDYSNILTPAPAKPQQITECYAATETSVKLAWTACDTAESYEVQYTTQKSYFEEAPNMVQSMTVEVNHCEVTGLDPGFTYSFRVKAINDKGESGWSGIASLVIGTKPSAPTTWSSTTTAVLGEKIILYWVHNSEDNSSQKSYDLQITINGMVTGDIAALGGEGYDPTKEDKVYFKEIDTSKYNVDTEIKWKVRTAGISGVYGDWSIERTINIWEAPTLSLRVTDIEENTISTLTSFPFYVYGLARPNTQHPIGYHLSIISNSVYETIDNVGNKKTVNIGDAVYTKYFDISTPLLVEFTPGNIDLQNGVNYTVKCIVTMNTGLNTETTTSFTVDWVDNIYYPNARLGFDENTYAAYIGPFCTDDEGALIDNITLSVYRRDYDGGFTEIATGLKNTDNVFVTDPHPSLNFARYRIVAISDTTGAVSFYDMPSQPVGGDSIIIQWDEVWQPFNATGEVESNARSWVGSMLKFPYNVDVNDRSSQDVALAKYIGREHPVSYYGTQLGVTATWSAEVPADDIETISGLRRLQRWSGDVYVREPSGSGYWANVSVSFDIKHTALTVPVTFEITRVEGGV